MCARVCDFELALIQPVICLFYIMHEGRQRSTPIVLPGGKPVEKTVVILVGQYVGGGRFVRDWMCKCVTVRKSDRLRSCSR